MKRFARHFAGDVPLHMMAVGAVISVMALIQVAFRCVVWLSDSKDVPTVLTRAGEAFAGQLDVTWTLICAIGLCSAMAHWSRRGQDHIAAWAGFPFWRVAGPGFAICLVVLISGTEVIGLFLPNEVSSRLSWNDGTTWGAALRIANGPWSWIEVQTTEEGTSWCQGLAASQETLPAVARGVELGAGGPETTTWHRFLFLILIGGLMLRAMRLNPRRASVFAFVAPAAGWILWGKTASLAATLLGNSLTAEILAPAIAATAIVGLGLIAIHQADR